MDARGNAGMLPTVPPEMTVPSPLARPARWLAPVLVGGALVYVTTVGFGGGGRAALEASVRMRWGSPVEAPGIARDLDGYLERYGAEPEARWFAIEALARVGRAAAAVDVAAATPGFSATPGALKRLATLLLETLGTDRADPTRLTWLFPRTVQARIEAGDARAREELERVVAKLPTNGIIGLFMVAVRSPGSAGSRALGEALARRADVHEFRAAAAILLTGPHRVDDVPFLEEVLRSTWREDRRPTWQQVVRVLGATGDARAVGALLRAREEAPPEPSHARNVQETLDVGLALAERPDARERVMSRLHATDGEWIAVLYANGLLTRWVHGDDGAVARMAQVWDADPPGTVRIQLLYGCVMAEKPPEGLPLEAWAGVAANATDPLAKTLGLVWRFRRKVPGAADDLLALLRTSLRGYGLEGQAGGETAEASSALDILRAFARWG